MKYADGGLLIAALLVAWSFYSAHRNRDFSFNLFDLIMDGGRISKVAVAFMLTLAVTSWIMIRLTLESKMTDGYFLAYGGMWVAPLIARMFKVSDQPPEVKP